MFRDEHNLTDSSKNVTDSAPGLYRSRSYGAVAYTKTHKLITALYMVTDMIDKEEPLRIKLRTLGTDILSDMNALPYKASARIAETLSFLDIAQALSIISPMNCEILRKEFSELEDALDRAYSASYGLNAHIDLKEFLQEASPEEPGSAIELSDAKRSFAPRARSSASARLGIQKGSTLVSALKGLRVSDTTKSRAKSDSVSRADSSVSDIAKKQRREEIIKIIKERPAGATIKDIRDRAAAAPAGTNSLAACGEKTIQRELVAMVKDKILRKTGEKRWSRYFLA